MTFYLPPGGGETVQIGTTTRTTFKVTGAQTSGRFGLFEHRMAPGAPGALPHFHRQCSEMFYVVRGTVRITLDDQAVDAAEGSFVHVPEEAVHGFANTSTDDATMLIMFYPDIGRQGFFEGLSELTRAGQRTPSAAELTALMEKFDQFEI